MCWCLCPQCSETYKLFKFLIMLRRVTINTDPSYKQTTTKLQTISYQNMYWMLQLTAKTSLRQRADIFCFKSTTLTEFVDRKLTLFDENSTKVRPIPAQTTTALRLQENALQRLAETGTWHCNNAYCVTARFPGEDNYNPPSKIFGIMISDRVLSGALVNLSFISGGRQKLFENSRLID